MGSNPSTRLISLYCRSTALNWDVLYDVFCGNNSTQDRCKNVLDRILSSTVECRIKLSDEQIKNGFPHSLIILYSSIYSGVCPIDEEDLSLAFVA